MTPKDVFARLTELSFLIGVTWSLLLYIVPLLSPYITGLALVPWMVAVPWLPILLVAGGLLNALTWERGWYVGKTKRTKTLQSAEDDRTRKWKITLAHMTVAALVCLVYPSILAGVYYMISMALLYVVSRVVTNNISFFRSREKIKKGTKDHITRGLSDNKNTFDKVNAITSRMQFLVLGIITLAVFQAIVFSATSVLFSVSMGVLSFSVIMGLVYISRRLESFSDGYKKLQYVQINIIRHKPKERASVFLELRPSKQNENKEFSKRRMLMKTHREDLEVCSKNLGPYKWTRNKYEEIGVEKHHVETVQDGKSQFRELRNSDMTQIAKMTEEIVKQIENRTAENAERVKSDNVVIPDVSKNVKNSINFLKKCFEKPKWYDLSEPHFYFLNLESNKLDAENVSKLFNMHGFLKPKVLCKLKESDFLKAFETAKWKINTNSPLDLDLYADREKSFWCNGEKYIPVFGSKDGSFKSGDSEFLYLNAIRETDLQSKGDFPVINNSELRKLVVNPPKYEDGQWWRNPDDDIKAKKDLKRRIEALPCGSSQRRRI